MTLWGGERRARSLSGGRGRGGGWRSDEVWRGWAVRCGAVRCGAVRGRRQEIKLGKLGIEDFNFRRFNPTK